MLTYAGVRLLHNDPGLLAWAAEHIPPWEFRHFQQRAWPGPGLEFTDHVPDWPGSTFQTRLGVLFWPTGASRWATFHALCDQGQLDLIRQACFSNGTLAPRTLVLDDEGGGQIQTQMYLLPARPLQQTEGDRPAGLWLLTLVDERYFWHFRAANLSVSQGFTTWGDLYEEIALQLGIGLDVDPIGDYLFPHERLGTAYEDLPALLDAVALSTGLRIVRQLDGTVRAWSAGRSKTSQDQQYDLLQDKLAGGRLEVGVGGGTPGFVGTGDSGDSAALLPREVVVVFPRADCVANELVPVEGEFHAVSVTLNDLAASGTAGVQGFDGAKVFHSPAWATPQSLTLLRALAEQIARDYYLYQLGRLDLSLAGFRGWTLTGYDDALHLVHGPGDTGDCRTRVTRAPFNETAEEMHQGNDPEVSCPAEGSGSGSGSGSGAGGGEAEECDDENIQWRTLCEAGRLNLYGRSVRARVDPDGVVCFTETPWVFVREMGCCECEDAGSASGAGSGPGPGGPGDGLACCECEAVPAAYTLVVAGVTNAACAVCNNYNGTFSLQWTGSGCNWVSTSGEKCGGLPGHLWSLNLDLAANEFTLAPAGSWPAGAPSYVLPCNQWNCLGSNTLPLVATETDQCTGWPSQLTVIPL